MNATFDSSGHQDCRETNVQEVLACPTAVDTIIDDESDEVVVDWRTWMAVISGASCIFSTYFTGLMLGNTAAAVATTFGEGNLAIWLPNGFAIVTATIGGLVGCCSDKIGRKNILLGGILICMLGCILIAVAQNMTSVLVGAAMCSGLFVNQGNILAIPAEVLPRRYRGIGATVTVFAGGSGAFILLLFTGATVRDTHALEWRSTYIFGACVNFTVIALLYTFYRPLGSPKEAGVTTFGALKKHVDWLGALILAVGLGLLMSGVTLGGTAFPWSSAPVIGTLAGGATTLIVLAIHQIFLNKHGILDHDLWTKSFCVAWFGCFVEGVVYYALLVLFMLESITFWENRPFFRNARLLAFFLTSAVVAPLVGLYTRKTKDLVYPLIAGWTLVVIGIIILSVCDQHSTAVSLGALFLIGVGFTTPLALLFVIAQLATAPHLLGLTTGQLVSARAIGLVISASVLVAVFKAKLAATLPHAVSSAAVLAGLPEISVAQFVGGIAATNDTLIESTPGVTPAIITAGRHAAADAQVQSFHAGWYTALPFAIIALLLVFLLEEKKIKAQMTWLVERPVAVMEHVHQNEQRSASR